MRKQLFIEGKRLFYEFSSNRVIQECIDIMWFVRNIIYLIMIYKMIAINNSELSFREKLS
jgi:hypothetical protein